MKIVRKLGQSRELVGVDREVERPVHNVDVAQIFNIKYSISCIQYNVFNIWLDLSMMSMSPHCASKGIPASLVRCQAASMLVRLTGRKKHEFQGDVCTYYVPRKCLHCKLCTCYIPIGRGGSQEPNMAERNSGQLLLYIGRQPGR